MTDITRQAMDSHLRRNPGLAAELREMEDGLRAEFGRDLSSAMLLCFLGGFSEDLAARACGVSWESLSRGLHTVRPIFITRKCPPLYSRVLRQAYY